MAGGSTGAGTDNSVEAMRLIKTQIQAWRVKCEQCERMASVGPDETKAFEIALRQGFRVIQEACSNPEVLCAHCYEQRRRADSNETG